MVGGTKAAIAAAASTARTGNSNVTAGGNDALRRGGRGRRRSADSVLLSSSSLGTTTAQRRFGSEEEERPSISAGTVGTKGEPSAFTVTEEERGEEQREGRQLRELDNVLLEQGSPDWGLGFSISMSPTNDGDRLVRGAGRDGNHIGDGGGSSVAFAGGSTCSSSQKAGGTRVKEEGSERAAGTSAASLVADDDDSNRNTHGGHRGTLVGNRADAGGKKSPVFSSTRSRVRPAAGEECVMKAAAPADGDTFACLGLDDSGSGGKTSIGCYGNGEATAGYSEGSTMTAAAGWAGSMVRRGMVPAGAGGRHPGLHLSQPVAGGHGYDNNITVDDLEGASSSGGGGRGARAVLSPWMGVGDDDQPSRSASHRGPRVGRKDTHGNASIVRDGERVGDVGGGDGDVSGGRDAVGMEMGTLGGPFFRGGVLSAERRRSGQQKV